MRKACFHHRFKLCILSKNFHFNSEIQRFVAPEKNNFTTRFPADSGPRGVVSCVGKIGEFRPPPEPIILQDSLTEQKCFVLDYHIYCKCFKKLVSPFIYATLGCVAYFKHQLIPVVQSTIKLSSS